jgi:D-amino-acid dehydrogenase/Ca-activated chloride channel family protein
MENAKKELSGHSGDHVQNIVYVVSDGVETCGGDPVEAAKALNQSDIQAVVNIIGFDVDDAGQKALKAVADAGKGTYATATTGADLEEHFKLEYDRLWREWDLWEDEQQRKVDLEDDEKIREIDEMDDEMVRLADIEDDRLTDAWDYLEDVVETDVSEIFDWINHRESVLQDYANKKESELQNKVNENESKLQNELNRMEEEAYDKYKGGR